MELPLAAAGGIHPSESGVRPAGVVSHLLTRAVTGAVRGEKLEDIMLAGADKDL